MVRNVTILTNVLMGGTTVAKIQTVSIEPDIFSAFVTRGTSWTQRFGLILPSKNLGVEFRQIVVMTGMSAV